MLKLSLVPELKDPANNRFIRNYAFTREIEFDLCLVEIGFMSNPEDLKIIIDPAKQVELPKVLLGRYTNTTRNEKHSKTKYFLTLVCLLLLGLQNGFFHPVLSKRSPLP